MRVVKRLRGKKGEIKIYVESLDDLWHLRNLIENGDLVRAYTERVIKPQSKDRLRPEEPRVSRMMICISAESVEFDKFSKRLRIRGKIVEGEQKGSYHTINVNPFSEISIEKEWRDEQIRRIDDAARESRVPNLLILTIEEGECIAGVLRPWGVEEIFDVSMSYGKMDERRREFFGKVMEKVRSCSAEKIVVAGPGFAKDDFLKFVSERDRDLAGKMIVESCSSIGIPGFQEILRRGVLERISVECRISREAKLIDELLRRIAQGKMFAYGRDVERAAELGAVEDLMVIDEKLPEVACLVEKVERARGRVTFFSSDFEPGMKLKSLGGIAALLRFEV